MKATSDHFVESHGSRLTSQAFELRLRPTAQEVGARVRGFQKAMSKKSLVDLTTQAVADLLRGASDEKPAVFGTANRRELGAGFKYFWSALGRHIDDIAPQIKSGSLASGDIRNTLELAGVFQRLRKGRTSTTPISDVQLAANTGTTWLRQRKRVIGDHGHESTARREPVVNSYLNLLDRIRVQFTTNQTTTRFKENGFRLPLKVRSRSAKDPSLGGSFNTRLGRHAGADKVLDVNGTSAGNLAAGNNWFVYLQFNGTQPMLSLRGVSGVRGPRVSAEDKPYVINWKHPLRHGDSKATTSLPPQDEPRQRFELELSIEAGDLVLHGGSRVVLQRELVPELFDAVSEIADEALLELDGKRIPLRLFLALSVLLLGANIWLPGDSPGGYIVVALLRLVCALGIVYGIHFWKPERPAARYWYASGCALFFGGALATMGIAFGGGLGYEIAAGVFAGAFGTIGVASIDGHLASTSEPQAPTNGDHVSPHPVGVRGVDLPRHCDVHAAFGRQP